MAHCPACNSKNVVEDVDTLTGSPTLFCNDCLSIFVAVDEGFEPGLFHKMMFSVLGE